MKTTMFNTTDFGDGERPVLVNLDAFRFAYPVSGGKAEPVRLVLADMNIGLTVNASLLDIQRLLDPAGAKRE